VGSYVLGNLRWGSKLKGIVGDRGAPGEHWRLAIGGDLFLSDNKLESLPDRESFGSLTGGKVFLCNKNQVAESLNENRLPGPWYSGTTNTRKRVER